MIYLDHHKWLVESNLLTDEMKDNIGMGGYCLVEDTIEAATSIDFINNKVHYRLVLPEELCNNLDLLNKYEKTKKLGFFEMRRLKKFLEKKKQNDDSGMGYRLEEIANAFVKTYLTNKWSAKVDYISASKYDGKKDLWLYSESDLRSN